MKRKRIIKTNAKSARTIMMVFLQIALIIGFTNCAIAQELSPSVVSSSGESFMASGVSLDFTIGEIVTETYTEQDFMLTQGFLQGKKGETAIGEQPVNASDIDVYPNPSRNMVHVMYKGREKPTNVEIIGMHGCMVRSVQFTNNPMAVDLQQLNPGLYVMRLLFSDHNSVSTKIIKK